MNRSLRFGTAAMEDLSALVFAQYMAQTARSAEARRMFEAYVERERQRIDGKNGYWLARDEEQKEEQR